MNFTRTALLACVISVATVVAASPGLPASGRGGTPEQPVRSVSIPGPLAGFERMAAISTKVSTDQVLPLLARNVFTHGYDGWGISRQATEYLVLLKRYVQQARELRSLADNTGVISVPS